MSKCESHHASDTIANNVTPVIERYKLANLTNNVDANNFKTSGIYYLGRDCLNIPSNWMTLHVVAYDGNNVSQIATSIEAHNSDMYIRCYTSVGWSEWKKLAFEAGMGWTKHIDVATGATVSLPTKFNELNVSVLVNNNNSDCYTFHIVKADLPSFGRMFRNGQYAGTNDWARVNLWGSSTQMYVANAQRNGVEYKTGSTMTIYYR